METTKIGHCCLFVKSRGVTVLTDPDAWSDDQNSLTGIDYVIITHEHFDHFHIDSVQQVLGSNPEVVIITNSAVASLLADQNISATIVEDQQTHDLGSLPPLAAFGTKHAIIYSAYPNVMNTGYLFDNTFFILGDAFTKPGVPVKVLALPVIAPWMQIQESLDWATQVQPEICFPVHDGMLHPRQWIYGLPAKHLPRQGIQFDHIMLPVYISL